MDLFLSILRTFGSHSGSKTSLSKWTSTYPRSDVRVAFENPNSTGLQSPREAMVEMIRKDLISAGRSNQD